MSTASKGKKNERKLANAFRDIGWTGERVPRSVADSQPYIDDVLVSPYEVDHDGHRPLTTALVEEEMDFGDMYRLESKYSSSNGFGAATLYKAHLETVGLGGTSAVRWADGWATGGPHAFAWYHTRPEEWELYEHDHTLPKSTRALVADDPHVDGAAIRLAAKPFVLVWRM